MTGHEICILRDRLGYSQQKLAVTLGVCVASVHRWETGKSRPSPLAIDKLRILEEQLESSQVEVR